MDQENLSSVEEMGEAFSWQLLIVFVVNTAKRRSSLLPGAQSVVWMDSGVVRCLHCQCRN